MQNIKTCLNLVVLAAGMYYFSKTIQKMTLVVYIYYI